jgi:hypothetical protein
MVYTIVAPRNVTIKMTGPGAYDQLIGMRKKEPVRCLRRIGETTAKFNDAVAPCQFDLHTRN